MRPFPLSSGRPEIEFLSPEAGFSGQTSNFAKDRRSLFTCPSPFLSDPRSISALALPGLQQKGRILQKIDGGFHAPASRMAIFEGSRDSNARTVIVLYSVVNDQTSKALRALQFATNDVIGIYPIQDCAYHFVHSCSGASYLRVRIRVEAPWAAFRSSASSWIDPKPLSIGPEILLR